MTLAAADAVDGGEATPELITAWQCQRWHCLPSELYREDARTMTRMTHALNVYETVQAAKNTPKLAEWAENNPEAARLFIEIQRMRQSNG